MLSIKLAETFAVLNVIRFPKSNDFCAKFFTSDLVFCQVLGLSVSVSTVAVSKSLNCCCSVESDRFGASFGRAITMAAPTDNAHNNAQ